MSMEEIFSAHFEREARDRSAMARVNDILRGEIRSSPYPKVYWRTSAPCGDFSFTCVLDGWQYKKPEIVLQDKTADGLLERVRRILVSWALGEAEHLPGTDLSVKSARDALDKSTPIHSGRSNRE